MYVVNSIATVVYVTVLLSALEVQLRQCRSDSDPKIVDLEGCLYFPIHHSTVYCLFSKWGQSPSDIVSAELLKQRAKLSHTQLWQYCSLLFCTDVIYLSPKYCHVDYLTMTNGVY